MGTVVFIGVIAWAAVTSDPTSPNQYTPYVETESPSATSDPSPAPESGRSSDRSKDFQPEIGTVPKPSRRGQQQSEQQTDDTGNGSPEDFCSEQYDLIWDMYRSGDISRRDFEIMSQEIEDSCIGY